MDREHRHDRAELDSAVLCWPAEREAALRGWSLRTGSSPTLRANSAFPYTHSADLSEETLALIEAFFRERARVPAIRIVPFGPTAALDGELAAAGYGLYEPTLVLVRELAPPGPPAGGVAHLDERAWLSALAEVAGQPSRVREHYASVLPRAPQEQLRLAIHEGGRPIAVALGLSVDQWVGLFDLVVAPAQRGRGLARRLVRALLDEAARRRAHRAFLYVRTDNDRALALYTGLGFREAYGYHYRVLR